MSRSPAETETATAADADGAEVLVVTAHAESGPIRYGQSLRVGHHAIPCDEPASRGGADTGASPTGLLLAALAGCTSITLRMYADKKGWELGQVRVTARLLRGREGERVERTIELGAALTPEQRARLLEIAEKTPVTKTLKSGLAIATNLG